MAEGFHDYIDVWESSYVATEEYRALDDERVLVLVLRVARGKASGLEITEIMRTQGTILFHVREGKVTRLVLSWDRDRALADLGLAPEVGSPDRERPG